MLDWLTTDPTVLAAVEALKLAVLAFVVGILGLAAKLLWGLSPMVKAAIQEWVTSKATARFKSVLTAKASAIVDPSNPASSVAAKAAEVIKGYPDMVQILGASQASVEKALSDTVSEVRVAPPEPVKAGGGPVLVDLSR